MARLSRVCPVGVPQHVIQRGNNRQVCFSSEQDFAAYAGWLKDHSKKYQVEIHAWVLMTNHVHLLCTPRADHAVSQMMQSLGRHYVRYFNFSRKRTGTLLGRPVVQVLPGKEEDYLLRLYRYIELNPVRAGMVEQSSDYVWSSYPINVLGKASELCSPHPLYLALGSGPKERQSSYRELFRHHAEEDIRFAANKGMALGSGRFKAEVENLTRRRMTAKKTERGVSSNIATFIL